MATIYRNNAYNVVDKAASWTVLPDDQGKIFVITSAATATLPPVADVWNGWNCKFYAGADAALTVSAPTNSLITFNNAAANSVAFSTTSEKAGAGVEIIYDATLTKYFVFVSAEETQTMTVA